MLKSGDSDTCKTSATLLEILNEKDPALREVAWEEFHARYVPVISNFARRMGAKPQNVDDIVQDVMMGFCAVSPTFVYDPLKGRFRGYLKRCTLHALMKRVATDGKYQGLPLEVAETVADVSEKWDIEWANQQMRRAIETVRQKYQDNHTFRAFELYVLLDLPADEVAQRLSIRVPSVHTAKTRITKALRKELDMMQEMEG